MTRCNSAVTHLVFVFRVDTDRAISRSASRLAGKRVLVVEDNWVVAEAMRLLLEEAGLVVSGPSATAADAMRLVAERAPQLAIVDLKLKGEMALDLIDYLHDRGISIVVCSGFIPSRPAKAAAVVQKPFSGLELIEALGTVVLRSGKRGEH